MRRSIHGFTLIELLVVISIVTLLISILLPGLGQAREHARSAVCGSNQHQIGVGFAAYSSDYRGQVPTYPGDAPENLCTAREWYLFYHPYLSTSRIGATLADERRIYLLGERLRVFDCPSTGERTNYGFLATVAKTFDYRRVKQYRAYHPGTSVAIAGGTTPILTRLEEHSPRAILLIDSLSKRANSGAAFEPATAADAPEYGMVTHSIFTSWYYLNTSTVPGYAIPPDYATGVTWTATGVDANGIEREALSVGIHHSRGANILTADGAAQRYPISRYLPGFQNPLSAYDLIRLPAQRRIAN